MERNKILAAVAGLLFIEFLSGGVWGIHRVLSSLFIAVVLLYFLSRETLMRVV
jgi:hypothetical protein